MSKDLSAVLDMAIGKEIEAQAFYKELQGRVTDTEAKQALQFMAEEEKKHEVFLVQYNTGGIGAESLKKSQIVDYKIAEHLEKPDISGKMDNKDVYLIAAHRELNSYNFYKELAGMHRVMRQQAAVENLSHKQQPGHEEKLRGGQLARRDR